MILPTRKLNSVAFGYEKNAGIKFNAEESRTVEFLKNTKYINITK